MTPLLTMRQVASFLGISVSKTYVLVGSGAIPSVLIGERSRRVDPKALQQYVVTRAANAVAQLSSI